MIADPVTWCEIATWLRRRLYYNIIAKLKRINLGRISLFSSGNAETKSLNLKLAKKLYGYIFMKYMYFYTFWFCLIIRILQRIFLVLIQ